MEPGGIARLDALTDEELDVLPYGVVAMDKRGRVVRFNHAEAECSGLRPEEVIGRHFFDEIAPCMNNFIVAEPMMTEASIDDVVRYTLSARVETTDVFLRLLKSADRENMYLLLRRL